MQDRPNDLLLLAGKILTIIAQIGLVIGGIAISIAAPVMLIFKEEVSVEFAQRASEISGPTLIAVTFGLLAIGLAIITLAYLFMGKLRAIISSVGEGDPFAPVNADRLNMMAWQSLAIQLLMLPAMGLGLMLGKVVDKDGNAEITIDAGLDIEGILIVIVLFILARVFKHGAAMRDDLEGTV